MENKACNHNCYCSYRIIGGTVIECKYSGYCDFQTPRDSREIKFCECGIYNSCTADGVHCQKCGRIIK